MAKKRYRVAKVLALSRMACLAILGQETGTGSLGVLACAFTNPLKEWQNNRKVAPEYPTNGRQQSADLSTRRVLGDSDFWSDTKGFPMKYNIAKVILGCAVALTAFGCSEDSFDTNNIANSTSFPNVRLFATAGDRLVSFDSGNPGTLTSNTTITGLALGETIVGLDFRPATNTLVAVGSTSLVYTVDKVSGAATVVNATAFTPGLNGTVFGVDFNPTVDRIRVVSEAGQNLRLNPNTGAVAAVDTNLAYAAGDSGAGVAPRIVASAYSNNVSGATTTQLFGIDSNRDAIVLQNPPNNGVLNTLGGLNFDTDDRVGFDIGDGDAGFASLTANVPGTTQSDLFYVKPGTREFQRIGKIGGTVVTSLTINR